MNKLAIGVIESNEYLSLASVDETGKSWVCILAYCFDVDYSLYFVSLPTSRHAIHFLKNNSVSFSIFDSHQEFGKGVGLQVEAIANEVENKEFQTVEDLYFSRVYPYGNINNDFVGGLKNMLNQNIYKFYKLTPTHIWINDPEADIDKRVEISLKG